MLISTRVMLGLMQDIHLILFFEPGIRGGKNGDGELRHLTANEAHLDIFDPRHKTTFGFTMKRVFPRYWSSQLKVASKNTDSLL